MFKDFRELNRTELLANRDNQKWYMEYHSPFPRREVYIKVELLRSLL